MRTPRKLAVLYTRASTLFDHTGQAKLPAEIGEVRIAPETVKTDNAVADVVEKPITTEHITTVEDPTVIPTPEVPISIKQPKPPLKGRPFIRNESKP